MKKTLEFQAHNGEIEDIALSPDNKVRRLRVFFLLFLLLVKGSDLRCRWRKATLHIFPRLYSSRRREQEGRRIWEVQVRSRTEDSLGRGTEIISGDRCGRHYQDVDNLHK